MVAADDMCAVLRNDFDLPASQIVLDEAGYDFRRSAESLRETLKVLGDRNLVDFGDRVPRVLVMVPALQGARAFLTFRQTGFAVVPFLTDYRVEPSRRPWPLHPKRRVYFRPNFLLFSAEGFAQADAAWQEIKSLGLYAIRFWIRPPLTDPSARIAGNRASG
ncbi:MAG: YdcF family protein [Oscillatoriales cyanobacterium SM2_1_8]|nr:YdcF family protein [Oscillatoriales cyanobacterium SM2_1_8]